MSQQPNYVQFFFQVADLGCTLKNAPLRDGARMLLSLVPPDTLTVQRLTALFKNYAVNGVEENISKGSDTSGQTTSSPSNLPPPTIENVFFNSSPSQVLYNLEVSMILHHIEYLASSIVLCYSEVLQTIFFVLFSAGYVCIINASSRYSIRKVVGISLQLCKEWSCICYSRNAHKTKFPSGC